MTAILQMISTLQRTAKKAEQLEYARERDQGRLTREQKLAQMERIQQQTAAKRNPTLPEIDPERKKRFEKVWEAIAFDPAQPRSQMMRAEKLRKYLDVGAHDKFDAVLVEVQEHVSLAASKQFLANEKQTSAVGAQQQQLKDVFGVATVKPKEPVVNDGRAKPFQPGQPMTEHERAIHEFGTH